jgi:hypothetical protein
LLSRSIDKPDYASHTEDECITHLNLRITVLTTEFEKHLRGE